jgi:hypothetical protein
MAVTTLTRERIVWRPPADVFDFVARNHFQNHPRWDPDVLEMTQTTPGPVVSARPLGSCGDRGVAVLRAPPP